MRYKPVIGLEIHAELSTKTKMFCDSLNDPNEKHPNINICPICLSHPGTLPVINIEAVKKVIMAGLALNCKIAEDTFFERKNYFYPDLPKGYQITQYQKPLCEGGELKISSPSTSSGFKVIRITRIHLEEDAGRLQHSGTGSDASVGASYSLVDYNRAGVPLMELVTEPDFETGLEVKKFAEELQLILRYLDVSDADMEKGLMRVEVNISLRPESPITNHQSPIKLGTKVEIKNLNSIKAASDSIDYEIKRQTELLEAGEKVVQETRGWDDSKKETVNQRSKEEAHDYRYFPEPDLPPLKFTPSQIQEIKDGLLELPSQRRARFALYGLTDAQIEIFTVARHLGDYYEHVATELDASAKDFHIKKGLKGQFPSNEPHIERRLHELSANYIITEFPVLMSAKGLEVDDLEGFKISPEAFAELMVLVFHKELSSTGAKVVLKEMVETGLHPEQIMKEKDLGQTSNSEELESVVNNIIINNNQAVEDYKKGKEASLKFLVGMVMRESKGKANPQMAEEILKKRLK